MKISSLFWFGGLVSGAVACEGHAGLHHRHEDIAKRQGLTLNLGLITITLGLPGGGSTVITTTTILPTTAVTSISQPTTLSSTTTVSQSPSASVSTISTTSKAATTTTTKTTTTKSTTTTTTTTGLLASATVKSTILVIARDQSAANQVINGLNGYGIPYQTLLVPQNGTALPSLTSSTTSGNFGGFVIVSGIAYYYDSEDQWHSALTNDQMTQLYNYQTRFGVRMVQLDAYPQYAYGTEALGGCCDSGTEQLVSFTNTAAFTQAGLKMGAGMTTQGLYHYPAKITDNSTIQIAQFAAGGGFDTSTAAVLQNIQGREQMAFFISWATDWSPTSNWLQHAYITWMTRGLYAGYRRVNLNTQIDDMMLPTGIYYPGNSANTYRLIPDDMNAIRDWVPKIRAKMNPGSFYLPEIGYNGNGNVRQVDPLNTLGVCQGGPIYTKYDTTPLEFQKVLGTGVDGWPATPTSYPYTSDCLKRDPLSVWFQTQSNRDTFLHISHTFSHEGQNNATYSDIYKEIDWNKRWLKQVGIAAGNYTANGIIPPAITGLHNGDALRAWYDNGITNCVGDNSRPVLRNQQNPMYAYNTTVAANGFAGITVIPRWSLRIYYNCDTPVCTTQQWIDTSGGSGDFDALMGAEKFDTNRRYFGLYRDGVMFHQLNLRVTNMTAITMADGTQVPSLFQAWVEQTVQEFNRLANWPMVALKQSDLANAFIARQQRDACAYSLSYTISAKKITGVTVTTNGNTCSATIPVTVPGTLSSNKGFATEKLGNDPLTVWVKMSGSPVTLTLASAISI